MRRIKNALTKPRRKDAAGIMRERLEEVHRMIPQSDIAKKNGLNLDIFLSHIAWEKGLTERTALKYLHHLQNLGHIEIDHDQNHIEITNKPASFINFDKDQPQKEEGE